MNKFQKPTKKELTRILSSIYFKLWITFFIIINSLAFIIVVNVSHRISYELPFNMTHFLFVVFLLLSGILLFIFVCAKYKYSKYSLSLLFIFPCITFILGIAYPYYHHRVSFSDKTITTVFNQKEFKQRFTFASIKNLNLTSVSKYGYKSSMTDKSVYVFFKLGCPYCQNSIPNLLEKLTEEEKKQVFFINLDDEKSNKLAQHLNINKAGTSLIVDHTSKSKKASFYYLFKINNGKAAANQESIFKIKQYLNRVVWNTRVIK